MHMGHGDIAGLFQVDLARSNFSSSKATRFIFLSSFEQKATFETHGKETRPTSTIEAPAAKLTRNK